MSGLANSVRRIGEGARYHHSGEQSNLFVFDEYTSDTSTKSTKSFAKISRRKEEFE